MKILFPERMKDLTIVVHDDYIEDAVEGLQKEGVVEISSIDRDRDVRYLVDPGSLSEKVNRCTEYDIKLSSVIDVLKGIKKEEAGLMDFFKPREIKRVKGIEEPLDAILDEAESLLNNSGKKILALYRRRGKIVEKIEDHENLKENLTSLLHLDVELSYFGESEYTVIKIGKTDEPDKFKKAISKIDTSFHHIERAGEEDFIVVAGTYIRRKNKLESAMRKGEVKQIDVEGIRGTPKTANNKLELKIKELEDEKDKITEELKKWKAEEEKRYLVLREEIDIHRHRNEVVQNFGKTDAASVIKAWTTSEDVDRVKDIVDKKTKGCSLVIAEDPEDMDDVPTSLKNPRFIRPFELLTNMFAPPSYDEVDPTFILAPVFVFFFGLMLGDAVYGAIITITAVVLVKGPGRVYKGIKDFGWILLAAGISTIFFGIIQGGFLGPGRSDYPNLLGHFGIHLPVLLDTLKGEGPLTLLIISLIIGLVYINTGLVLSLIKYIHKRYYKDILMENVSWWLLQPGGFILISGKLFGWFAYSDIIYTAAWLLVAGGLLLLIMRAKGLSFFELTGFIGDFLSFARILALGLATAGIALTVNVLSDLISGGTIGIIVTAPIAVAGLVLLGLSRVKDSKKMMMLGASLAVFGGLGVINPLYPFYILAIIVIIGGHLINLVLQALGSFVHSLRLQYVEFFGYFYEGGGSPFTPFKQERIHTEYNEKEVIE
ncbi:MAG: V-type ATP synthase subunit I [Thermoplasmata archaeon]